MERLRRNLKIKLWAFFGSLSVGVAAHGFAVFNRITNHDDMGMPYGGSNGVTYGRWMWIIWQKLDFMNTSVINGLLNLLLLSLAAALLVDVLEIHRPIVAAIAGAVFITHPANTTMFFYCRVMPALSAALFLAVLAVWSFQRLDGIWGFCLGCGCIITSLGNYQAYLAVTAAGLLLLLLLDCCREELTAKALILRAFRALGYLLASVIGYVLLTKLACLRFKTPLTDYQGISSMGFARLGQLPKELAGAYGSFFTFYNHIYGSDLARLGDVVQTVILVGGAIWALVRLAASRRWVHAVGFVLFVALLPVASNLPWLFGADNIHSLMIYGNVAAPLAVTLILDKIELRGLRGNILRGIVGTFAVLVLLTGTVLSNSEYLIQFKSQEQAVAYLREVIAQVRSTDGFTNDTRVALVGRCWDRDLFEFDKSFKRMELNSTSAVGFVQAAISNDWSREIFFRTWVGYGGTFLTADESRALLTESEITALPCNPMPGSVIIHNGVIVVHFSNTP